MNPSHASFLKPGLFFLTKALSAQPKRRMFPYQPVNSSQAVPVRQELMRCQPSAAARTGELGRAVRPQLPSHPVAQGCVQPFTGKEPREAKRGCNKTFPGGFCPHSCATWSVLERVGQKEDETRRGRGGICCPQPGSGATGVF